MADLRELVDFASDAAFAVAVDLRILAWNQAAREVLGYAASEVIGRSCYEVLQADLPGGEPLCTPACQGSLCFGRCQPFAVQACLARHRDGRRVPLGLSTLVVPSKADLERPRAMTAIIFLHLSQAASTPEPLPQPLRVYTFGRFGLVVDGRHVSVERWERKQALTLLKFLVVHRGTAVHRDRLIECLWPGVEDGKGRERLKVTVYFLRHQLDANGRRHDLVETVGDGYALRREASWVDADTFERLVTEGTALDRQDRWDEALRCYRDAMAIYRGDYLEADLYADWCAEERERLREIYFEMLARMVDILVRQGRFVEAAQACRRALVREPCRESFHRTLIECLLDLGQPDQAAVQFRRCREVLARELDAEPLPETQRLYQRILAARPSPSKQTA